MMLRLLLGKLVEGVVCDGGVGEVILYCLFLFLILVYFFGLYIRLESFYGYVFLLIVLFMCLC